ncbi:MAG: carbon storage regulator [Planctomycetota bacterium]
MLVLTRKVGEEIRLVEAGVTIRIKGATSSRAQVAIDAPRELTVLRGELDSSDGKAAVHRTAQSAMKRLACWAESMDADQLGEEISLLDELIERLLELQLAARRSGLGGGTDSARSIPKSSTAANVMVRQSKAGFEVESTAVVPHLPSSKDVDMLGWESPSVSAAMPVTTESHESRFKDSDWAPHRACG